MALNWKVSNIDNYKIVCFRDWNEETQTGKMRAITHNLIYITMIVGIQEITEDNYKVFHSRLKMYERLFGAFLSKKNKRTDQWESSITLEDIKDHIGLWTNASNLTRHKFMKNVEKRWEQDNFKLEVK